MDNKRVVVLNKNQLHLKKQYEDAGIRVVIDKDVKTNEPPRKKRTFYSNRMMKSR